ncbi:hypothetical protein [Mycetocola saprophilus]|uniref:hypothetical protein n=1 Tax=Mycetocola saprophilus TaxID=76636 RepID=UPI003BF3A1CF
MFGQWEFGSSEARRFQERQLIIRLERERVVQERRAAQRRTRAADGTAPTACGEH